MKTKLIFFGLILISIGCNNSQQEDKATDDTGEINEIDTTSTVVTDSEEPIWKYDYNQRTQDFELKQLRTVDKNTLTGESLEKVINKAWPRVQIKFIRTSNDTAYIAIPDSRVMTQQMGSAGAHGFMISTTYTLTELRGIKYVSYDFEVGDHAMPGVYNRNSWDDRDLQ